MTVKKMLFIILKTLGIIVGIVVLYIALGYGLPFIEVSAKDDGQKKEIPIYIYTNGVHTDIVMPVKMIFMTGAPKFLSPIQNPENQTTGL